MATKTEDKKLLEKLAELGGARFQEDDITYSGTKLVIPERMTAKKAVQVIQAHIEAMDELTSFDRTFKFRPWDGALATSRAIKALTGTTGIGKTTYSFFGVNRPSMITINVGVAETEQVPWGEIEVPLFEGTVNLGGVQDAEYGPLFRVRVTAPRKYKASIEGLFKLIEEELRERSIYRGKAFDGQDMPEFIDLEAVDPKKVVYSDAVTLQFEANVWSMLEHTESMRRAEVPLKRSVLLHGPYGTGKTLAAFITAQKAVESGWTFVYCRPGRDDLNAVMATARLYQPAVVFFEDVDTISSPAASERDEVSRLLDMFDGITAKGTELLAIMTTNHPDRIHKGMVRPGRLDAVIEIGALDEHGVEKMIGAVCEPDVLSELEYDEIAVAMDGFLPAFVKEAVDRAKRYAIARNGGEIGLLETTDFVLAANGLRPQLEMMEAADESTTRPTIDVALASMVQKALDDTSVVYVNEDDREYVLRTNGRR